MGKVVCCVDCGRVLTEERNLLHLYQENEKNTETTNGGNATG